LYQEGSVDYSMIPNSFTHWTSEEFQNYLKVVAEDLPSRSKRSLPQGYAAIPNCDKPPSSKNWVAEGKVQGIKDQGSCRCCYVFASVSVTESAVAIKYGVQPPNYSEQHNLDCAQGDCINGGQIGSVWNLAKSNEGMVNTADYNPYAAVKGACVDKKYDSRATTAYYEYLPEKNEDKAPCFVNENGPVVAHFYVASDLQFAGKGVYKNTDGECAKHPNDVNHAFTIVGYGTETRRIGFWLFRWFFFKGLTKQTPYWLVKNSWGTSYGKVRHKLISSLKTILKNLLRR
jgi:C1A family cysteine protease